MNKKRVIYNSLMIAILSITVTVIITSTLMYNYFQKEAEKAKVPTQTVIQTSELDKVLASLKNIIDKKYLGTIDEQELYDNAIKGYIAGLGDKYSAYYTPKEVEELNLSVKGNFVGVGAYLQENKQNDTIKILFPIEDSPAKEAGLQAGDIIAKVDGVEYKGSQIEQAATAMKGEEGTNVELEIIRDGEIKEFTITRRNIKMYHVEGRVLENDIGYICIQTFDEECAKEFKEKYEELKKNNIKSLIIDLRDNGGGIVNEAIEMLDYLLDKDLITLITIDKDEKEVVTKTKNDKLIDVPVAVLVNGNTASASEIMAGALKDHGRAKIVGEKTYGKGVIQELMYLSNKAALKLTTNEYFTPNRNKINEVGITPDVEVKLEISQDNLEDTQLKKAIEILK